MPARASRFIEVVEGDFSPDITERSLVLQPTPQNTIRHGAVFPTDTLILSMCTGAYEFHATKAQAPTWMLLAIWNTFDKVSLLEGRDHDLDFR